MRCPSGRICQLQSVQCIRAPCPAIPTCVDREPSPQCLNQVCDFAPLPAGCVIMNYLTQEGCHRCTRTCPDVSQPCPIPLCITRCPQGFVLDEMGCQTCDCVTPGPDPIDPPPCASVACAPRSEPCRFGLVIDENGCSSSCDCRRDLCEVGLYTNIYVLLVYQSL